MLDFLDALRGEVAKNLIAMTAVVTTGLVALANIRSNTKNGVEAHRRETEQAQKDRLLDRRIEVYVELLKWVKEVESWRSSYFRDKTGDRPKRPSHDALLESRLLAAASGEVLVAHRSWWHAVLAREEHYEHELGFLVAQGLRLEDYETTWTEDDLPDQLRHEDQDTGYALADKERLLVETVRAELDVEPLPTGFHP